MALKMTATILRLTLAVSLTAILASCATDQGHSPSARVVLPDDLEAVRPGNTVVATARGGADTDPIESNAPEVYRVVRGDTLWDISDRFLKEPWRWSEIWGYNPQIVNPHLIYPGDELKLQYLNGKPVVSLTRNGVPLPLDALEPALLAASPDDEDSAAGRVKLDPRIRSEPLESAIPTISGEALETFLVHPRVVDLATLTFAPRVIANSDDRLISSAGSKIYVRGRLDRTMTEFGVFRRHKTLIDPITGANLGYEVTHVSDASLLSIGDPSTLILTGNKMETIAGDILLPLADKAPVHDYIPRMPDLDGQARILSLVNALSRTGRDQVVVLNVGTESKIQPGDVLAVEARGRTVTDKKSLGEREEVQLPNQRTGVLLVFKTFDKVSYALVMESTRPLSVNDIVTGI